VVSGSGAIIASLETETCSGASSTAPSASALMLLPPVPFRIFAASCLPYIMPTMTLMISLRRCVSWALTAAPLVSTKRTSLTISSTIECNRLLAPGSFLIMARPSAISVPPSLVSPVSTLTNSPSAIPKIFLMLSSVFPVRS